jgi:hypothetical protein
MAGKGPAYANFQEWMDFPSKTKLELQVEIET